MISREKLEENFKKFCEENGLMNNWVTFEEYHIDNDFFEKNDHVWDEISYDDGDNPKWEENDSNLEFDIDGWFASDYPDCPDNFKITEELYDALNIEGYITDVGQSDWYIQDEESEDYNKFIHENEILDDLPDELKEIVNNWWGNHVDIEYLEDNEWILESLGLGDLEENYSYWAAKETMAYWTIYFEPRRSDWNAAYKAGLLPFIYYGTFMLALGGCGQDLSPKLDCYQALVSSNLPSDSQIFRDVKYFDSVSPVKHEVILNKCRREYVKVEFIAEIKE